MENEDEVEDGGEVHEVVLTAGGDSNRLCRSWRNNEVGIGYGELLGVEFLLEHVLDSKVSASQIFKVLSSPALARIRPWGSMRRY